MKPLALLLLLVCGAVGQSKNIMESNGVDWQRSSDNFKTGYVVGYIAAMTRANEGEAIMCVLVLNLKTGSEESNACVRHAQGLVFTNGTVGQFIQGMDAFYKDFRNTEYPMHAAMSIVRDQISGRAADDIEKELTSWRQCHADNSKCEAFLKELGTPSSQTSPATKK